MYARLSFFYAAYFTMIGISLPFLPVWLQARGLGASEIGYVIAAGLLVKMAIAPWIAAAVDRSGRRRRALRGLAVAALAAFLLLPLGDGFWALLGIYALFSVAWSTIMPLGENITLLSARAHRLQYGRVRLWGSLAFIGASVAAGQALEARGADLVYAAILGAVGLSALAAWPMPEPATGPGRDGHRPLRGLLADPAFLLMCLAAALIQSSHGVYYTFGTLHWQSVGHGEGLIGALWAEGVIAEILLFAVGSRIVARSGALPLLLAGGLAAGVRWTTLGLTDALPALLVVQALHALTYGAAHLGAMTYIARRVAADRSATAQSLYAASVMGVGMSLSTFAAGHLYAAAGGGAYLAMAGLGAAGAAVAAGLWRHLEDPVR